jgi:predicted metal-dependent peptidase
VENRGDIPDLLIYFTDGYGSYPPSEPGYPVVWVMTTDHMPPWGDLIEYNNEEESKF